MKLELKHLASYLPYGLEIKALSGEYEIVKLELMTNKGIMAEHLSLLYDEFKPILRPLSDLTKEIDGVVHLVDLKKLCSEFHYDKIDLVIFHSHDDLFGFKWKYEGNMSDDKAVPFQLYEYLFQYYFDVYGLIDKGLAIDINTIES